MILEAWVEVEDIFYDNIFTRNRFLLILFTIRNDYFDSI